MKCTLLFFILLFLKFHAHCQHSISPVHFSIYTKGAESVENDQIIYLNINATFSNNYYFIFSNDIDKSYNLSLNIKEASSGFEVQQRLNTDAKMKKISHSSGDFYVLNSPVSFSVGIKQNAPFLSFLASLDYAVIQKNTNQIFYSSYPVRFSFGVLED